MKAWDWAKNFFMPEAEGEYMEEEILAANGVAEEEKRARAVTSRKSSLVEKVETLKVANGGYESVATSVQSGSAQIASARLHVPNVMRFRQQNQTAVQHPQQQPAPQEFRINVFAPQSFDDVRVIADNIRGHKAAVVNYDKVDDAMQRRICDFMNGACYVLDGEVRRISSNMVLYVPAGVSIGDMASVAPISLG